MTTANDENVFVRTAHLFIKPTLQDAALIEKDNVIDLLDAGTCTSTQFADCVAATNTTAGNSTIVPPTRSGRITTRKGATIRYGRVEVTAKLPQGDWLWPAIWMMPATDVYGAWPASGEIDIMESRGNDWTYGQGGDNIVSSALHWGPDHSTDAWVAHNNKRSALHTTYSAGFNTYGLEWSQKYLFTYVNSRLLQVPLHQLRHPHVAARQLPQPPPPTARASATSGRRPAAQHPLRHALLPDPHVAVGGTNGWFQDGQSGKPWLDGSPNAKLDFWNAPRSTWLPTWVQPQMEVSKVMMWQQCDGQRGPVTGRRASLCLA